MQLNECIIPRKEKKNNMYTTDRSNHQLNIVIERFIDNYYGTAIGSDIKNMYENGSDYESICDRMGIEIEDYID